jgi:hypothetical protein
VLFPIRLEASSAELHRCYIFGGFRSHLIYVFTVSLPPTSTALFQVVCIMREFRDQIPIKKCLHPYRSGVIQLNVTRSSDLCRKSGSKPWSPIIKIPARESEPTQGSISTLYDTTIECALHPALSPNDRLSWALNRRRLK